MQVEATSRVRFSQRERKQDQMRDSTADTSHSEHASGALRKSLISEPGAHDKDRFSHSAAENSLSSDRFLGLVKRFLVCLFVYIPKSNSSTMTLLQLLSFRSNKSSRRKWQMGVTLKSRNKSLVYCEHYFEQVSCYFDSFIEVGVEVNTMDLTWHMLATGGFLVSQRASVTRLN